MSDNDARRRFYSQLLSESPLTRIAMGGQLPEVQVPPLETLSFETPAPLELSEDALLLRLGDLAYSLALRRIKPLGSEIGPNDELNVDCIAYCQGEILPFSVHSGWVLGPHNFDEDSLNLRQSLVGKTSGSIEIVERLVPNTHQVSKFHGLPAFFSIRINSATEIEDVDVQSPEFLAAAQRGDSLEAVCDELAKEWQQEQLLFTRNNAFSKFLSDLADQAGVTISDTLIDKEIGRRWRLIEGELLTRIHTPLDQQNLALGAWLESPPMRAFAEHCLKVTAVLRSVIAQERFLVDYDVREWFDTVSQGLGIDPTALRMDLKQRDDKLANQRLLESMTYLRAMDYVLSKVVKDI